MSTAVTDIEDISDGSAIIAYTTEDRMDFDELWKELWRITFHNIFELTIDFEEVIISQRLLSILITLCLSKVSEM